MPPMTLFSNFAPSLSRSQPACRILLIQGFVVFTLLIFLISKVSEAHPTNTLLENGVTYPTTPFIQLNSDIRLHLHSPTMRSAFDKIRMDNAKWQTRHQQIQQRNAQQQPIGQNKTVSLSDPSPTDVLRYRYHHGANLGSIFVLEKWLHPSMFPSSASANQTSELEAAKLAVQQLGLDGARSKFEAHWANAANDDDLAWLAKHANATSLRLPIGWFTLGPDFCKGTVFKDVAGLYQNSWSFVKQIVSKARAHGIGILLDLHALPGGANGGEHSGTNSGKAELWGNSTNLAVAQKAVEFMAKESKAMDGVIGIQVVNEAEYGAPGMYDWYDKLLSSLSTIDPTVPIYISDAWDLPTAIKYVNRKNTITSTTNPLVIDTHLYWAFTDTDKAKSPQQIIQEAGSRLSELDGHDGSVVDHGAVSVVVGEYSCVLADDTWAKSAGVSKSQLVNEFGQAQTKRYASRGSGSFFWTLKMDWMDGGEWGFKAQSNDLAVTSPFPLTLAYPDVQNRIATAQSGCGTRKQAAVDSHSNYWNSTAPGQTFEHWRYANGWDIGFNDALIFFGMRASGKLSDSGIGGDKIGLLDLWVRKRIIDSGQSGNFIWEFEQGLRKGIADFYDLAGI